MKINAHAIIAATTALLINSPVKSETIGISGFLFASPGICPIVHTDTCTNYYFVAGLAERLCLERPKHIDLIGHSMGASGVMDLVHRLDECGVKVDHAVMLDPQAHPYDIPKGTKTLTIYSSVMAGIGEGHADSVNMGGEHIGMALRSDIRNRIRSFLNR